jgi:hypothetical protein
MSVNICQTRRRSIPEGSHLRTRRREDMISRHLFMCRLFTISGAEPSSYISWMSFSENRFSTVDTLF